MIQEMRKDFGVEDKVEVAVRIKNIKQVEVKVFQLNSQEYYLKKKKEIDGTLNLNGLVANYSQVFSFDHSSFHQHLHDFQLDAKCLEQPGVFVVEFIGGGLSSRTVFQKGQLFLV